MIQFEGPPSRSQAIELTSGLANLARDGFDNDVTNYLLATVSGHGSVANKKTNLFQGLTGAVQGGPERSPRVP